MDKRIIIKQREILIFASPQQLAVYACKLWREIAAKAIAERNYFTVALSGGKSPIVFYQMLAQDKQNNYWGKTDVFQVDERFVPHNHQDSNFKLLQDNLFAPLKLPRSKIHAIQTDMSLQHAVQGYAKELDDFFQVTVPQYPQFDLIMLGVGKDGHTASIFPHHPEQLQIQTMVAATATKTMSHQRITISLPLINNARNVVFIVTGKDKAEILAQIIKQEDQQLPAALVKPVDGKLLFLLDAEAANWL